MSHVPALDGIRGVAVALIVWRHLELLVPAWEDGAPLAGSFLGVDLFFVLSGFLITSLLLGEQEHTGAIRFGGFFRRRALRLLPALLVLLGAHLGYAAVAGLPAGLERSSLLSILFYYSNWKIASELYVAEGLGHMWSLAVEEQFYLVWPFVVALLAGRRRPRALLPALLVAATVAVALHRAVLWRQGAGWLPLYVRTDTRADSLLIGALTALVWSRGPVVARSVPVVATAGLALVAVFAAVVPVDSPAYYLGGFTVVAVAAAAVVLGVLHGGWWGARLFAARSLRAIGRVSYGLYLWHLPVFTGVQRYGAGWSAPARVATGLSLAAIATIVSWWCIERPVLAWKDRLEARSTAATGSMPPRASLPSAPDPTSHAWDPSPSSPAAGGRRGGAAPVEEGSGSVGA